MFLYTCIEVLYCTTLGDRGFCCMVSGLVERLCCDLHGNLPLVDRHLADNAGLWSSCHESMLREILWHPE